MTFKSRIGSIGKDIWNAKIECRDNINKRI